MEVIQEYHSGPKAERITMGVVTLNLAEYVDASFEREEGITRRYLMQESKINSTIKVPRETGNDLYFIDRCRFRY